MNACVTEEIWVFFIILVKIITRRSKSAIRKKIVLLHFNMHTNIKKATSGCITNTVLWPYFTDIGMVNKLRRAQMGS